MCKRLSAMPLWYLEAEQDVRSIQKACSSQMKCSRFGVQTKAICNSRFIAATVATEHATSRVEHTNIGKQRYRV
jgi:hypothetical protein